MAQRGPGADTECLSQRAAGPSIFLLLWEMAGDTPELLGTSQSCSVLVHMVTLPESTSGAAGLCPHSG